MKVCEGIHFFFFLSRIHFFFLFVEGLARRMLAGKVGLKITKQKSTQAKEFLAIAFTEPTEIEVQSSNSCSESC